MSRPAGYRHTPETRAKLRAILRTPEAHAKMSAAQRNRPRLPHTAETKAKISAAKTGHRTGPRSAETRARMAVSKFGNTHLIDAPVKGECVYCFGPAQTYDHVIPRGRLGWDDPNNVVLCCISCNASKHHRTPEEWFAAST